MKDTEWPTTADGWAELYLTAHGGGELEQLHKRLGNKVGEGALAKCFQLYAQHVTAAQQAEIDKRFAHLPDDYDDNELREQLRQQQAEIERLKEQYEGACANLRREAQLACDLRVSQDQVVERCAQAVQETWPEAAAALRLHVDGISGEDWGELRRECELRIKQVACESQKFAQAEKEVERLRAGLLHLTQCVLASDLEFSTEDVWEAVAEAERLRAEGESRALDAAFAQMANDPDYQREAIALARDFAQSDWDALKVGTRHESTESSATTGKEEPAKAHKGEDRIMKRGELVAVKMYGGRILQRRVVQVEENTVIICAEEEWRKAEREHREPEGIRVPTDDLEVTPIIREAHERELREALSNIYAHADDEHCAACDKACKIIDRLLAPPEDATTPAGEVLRDSSGLQKEG